MNSARPMYTIYNLVSTIRERLKHEIVLSKVKTSAEIRTAIAHTSLIYASHKLAVNRGG